MHHLSTCNLVNKIDFKAGRCASSVCYKNASIWQSFLSIGGSNDIISISQSLISDQLKYLKENRYFEDGLKTITLYENAQFEQDGLDKEVKTRWMNEYYAYDLFNECEWKKSVDKFIESAISARRIISLFPTLVPAGQCKKARTKHPVDFQNVKNSVKTFKASLSLFLIPYLSIIRSKIAEFHDDDDLKYNDNVNQQQQSIPQNANLQIILSQFDPPEEYDENNEWKLPQLIDTVYCKCLIEVEDDAALKEFLASHNRCNVEECEILLKRQKKFEELVLLYESHGKHRAALDLMKVKSKDINGLKDKTIKYLQKLGDDEKNDKLILHFSEWVFKEDPNEALRIFTGKSFESNQQIGMFAANDPMNQNQMRPPKIDPIKVVEHLERIKTPIPTRIAYLEMLIFEGGEKSSIFHDDLIRLYLEEIFHAIHEQEKEDEESREKYGLAAGDIVELTQAFSLGKWGWVKAGTEARVSKVTPTPNHSIQVYVTFPETGTLGVVPKAQLKKTDKKVRIRPEKQEGRVGDLRRKLISFLKTSKYFIPTNIKNLFPKHILLEEQAWLRAQIPQHKEALNIIVYDLEDPDMADEYCQQIYLQFNQKLQETEESLMNSQRVISASGGGSNMAMSSSNPYGIMADNMDATKIKMVAKNQVLNDPKWIEAEKIYLTLLDVYLNPVEKYKSRADKFVQHALKMLCDNHQRVDPIAVFNKLPTNMKVKDSMKYMEAVFKSCFEKKREFQVKKNLLKQASLKLQLKRNLREESFQRINEETKCTKCNKRIGQVAFVRYPDQSVFHYVCFRPRQHGHGHHHRHHMPHQTQLPFNSTVPSILQDLNNDKISDDPSDCFDEDHTYDID